MTANKVTNLVQPWWWIASKVWTIWFLMYLTLGIIILSKGKFDYVEAIIVSLVFPVFSTVAIWYGTESRLYVLAVKFNFLVFAFISLMVLGLVIWASLDATLVIPLTPLGRVLSIAFLGCPSTYLIMYGCIPQRS